MAMVVTTTEGAVLPPEEQKGKAKARPALWHILKFLIMADERVAYSGVLFKLSVITAFTARLLCALYWQLKLCLSACLPDVVCIGNKESSSRSVI